MVRAAGETGQGDRVPLVSPAFLAQERRGDLSVPAAQRTGQGGWPAPLGSRGSSSCGHRSRL